MLTLDIAPGGPVPPAFAKQIRYLDAFGDVLEVRDVTEIFSRAESAGKNGLTVLDRFAKAHYPDAACSYEQLVFWPSECKWVIATKHNRVQERLALAEKRSPEEAARARRFARMMQGRDRL